MTILNIRAVGSSIFDGFFHFDGVLGFTDNLLDSCFWLQVQEFRFNVVYHRLDLIEIFTYIQSYGCIVSGMLIDAGNALKLDNLGTS